MTDLEAEKALAARRAVDEVREGMLVGLGTGSTAAHAIRELGRRVAGGLKITATATSRASEELATSLAIPVVPFETVAEVDVAIDGADEIDGAFRAIKGGGGALLREKIVAAAARRMIVAVDSSKVVATLGRFRLPIEVLPFAAAFVERAVTALGVAPARRMKADATPFRTDQGNYVFDLPCASIADPADLALRLDAIPGIVEHGLFLSEIDVVFVGRGSRVDTLTRPS